VKSVDAIVVSTKSEPGYRALANDPELLL
jgi:hypothetical protein